MSGDGRPTPGGGKATPNSEHSASESDPVPRDVTLETARGRFTLVQREAVLALDEDDARRLLARALDDEGGVATLRCIADELGCAHEPIDVVVAVMARALASGSLTGATQHGVGDSDDAGALA
ncbi:MAG: hypothetical protein IAG13_15810 [Deltaproteobacteria bacterium]|nr:hypothetical protein [Nannocystaceae bacterium]